MTMTEEGNIYYNTKDFQWSSFWDRKAIMIDKLPAHIYILKMISIFPHPSPEPKILLEL